MPFPEVFSRAAELGFQGIELFLETPKDAATLDAGELCLLSKQFQIPIYSVHAPSYERYLKEYVLKGLDFVKQTMRKTGLLAAELGAELVVIHPFPVLFQRERSREEFAELLQTTPLEKAHWSIENMPLFLRRGVREPHCLVHWAEFVGFCSDGVKMTLDTTHALSCGRSPLGFYERCAEIVENIHLSDFRKGAQHLPLGEGEWNFREFLRLLQRREYSGVLTLEIYPRRTRDPRFLKHSIQAIRESG